MIDFALDAERNEGMPPEKSIYQACLLRFRPDHDDDDGGAARRVAAWPLQHGKARNCADRMGIAIVGGLLLSQFHHALHHARDLSLYGSLWPLA